MKPPTQKKSDEDVAYQLATEYVDPDFISSKFLKAMEQALAGARREAMEARVCGPSDLDIQESAMVRPADKCNSCYQDGARWILQNLKIEAPVDTIWQRFRWDKNGNKLND